MHAAFQDENVQLRCTRVSLAPFRILLFAMFPVDYLDEDLCVFVFPLFGTRIVAVREGSSIAQNLSEIVVTD